MKVAKLHTCGSLILPDGSCVNCGSLKGKVREMTARQWRIAELEKARQVMIGYGQLKFSQEDWHGVQDAASDLRDIDNELDGLRYE